MVLTEQAARVSEDEALASLLTTLETTVDGQTAELAIVAESIDGVLLRYGLKLDSNGHVIGFLANNDGEEGGFDFVADYFRVWGADGSGGQAVFEIVGGVTKMRDVEIDGDLLVQGSVKSSEIAINAVSDGDTASLASPMSGNNAWRTAVTYTLIIPADYADWKVLAVVTGSQGFPSGSGTWEIRLMADGVRLAGAGGEKAEDSFALSGRVEWAPGTHTVAVEWRAGSNVSLSECNMNLFWFKR